MFTGFELRESYDWRAMALKRSAKTLRERIQTLLWLLAQYLLAREGRGYFINNSQNYVLSTITHLKKYRPGRVFGHIRC